MLCGNVVVVVVVVVVVMVMVNEEEEEEKLGKGGEITQRQGKILLGTDVKFNTTSE